MILCDNCKAARALAGMKSEHNAMVETLADDIAEQAFKEANIVKRIVESATGLVGGPTEGITGWAISCELMDELREQVGAQVCMG